MHTCMSITISNGQTKSWKNKCYLWHKGHHCVLTLLTIKTLKKFFFFFVNCKNPRWISDLNFLTRRIYDFRLSFSFSLCLCAMKICRQCVKHVMIGKDSSFSLYVSLQGVCLSFQLKPYREIERNCNKGALHA